MTTAFPVFAPGVLAKENRPMAAESMDAALNRVETNIGDYHISFTSTPSLVKPNQRGQINLQIKPVNGAEKMTGNVTFKLRESGLFLQPMNVLGVKAPLDNEYQQSVLLQQSDRYVVTAEFFIKDEFYSLDFPLQVGALPNSRFKAIAISVTVILFIAFVIGQLNRWKMLGLRSDSAGVNSGGRSIYE